MDPIDQQVPEIQSTHSDPTPALSSMAPSPALPPAPASPEPWETQFLLRVLMGPQGLRAGWSVLLFVVVMLVVTAIASAIFFQANLIDPKQRFTASAALFGELAQFIGMIAAGVVVALVERRRGNLLAFNLIGPQRSRRFIEGLLAGFLSLSALIYAMHLGGWLRYGPVALSGAQIFSFAALWGVAFLLVGFCEEGTFRCYLQFTLTRGINFWWALGVVGIVCLKLYFFNSGNGIWGVYILAGLGLVPCLLLHLNKAQSGNFWQAAWVASTLFGFVHTGNNGENWIGIFAAGAIGFVFVVSVWLTGSAWWAIGCHAAWDWAETYFYGAIDSGNVATTHYLTVTPAGAVLWSGGSDGPEGSVLVIGIIVLMLVALLAIYRRPKPAAATAPATELAAG